MNDGVFKGNSERVGDEGISRRLFLRATLAGGASLFTGRVATLFAAASENDNFNFSIGGDLPVNRLGFGAMRLTGEGIWGWPPDRENARKVLQRAVELGANLIDTADALAGNAADSRDIVARSLGGKHGVAKATVERRRVEDD